MNPTSNLSSDDWRRIARLLFDLGVHIREGIRADQRKHPNADRSSIHRVTQADTIYEIDRVSEESLLAWFEAHWPDDYPALVIAEGLGDEKGILFPRGFSTAQITILIDPIDGTRGLMYDKRSAWMLAGAAEGSPQTSHTPTLSDLRAGAMVEIPTRRQQISDGICGWVLEDGSYFSEAVRSHGMQDPVEPLDLFPSKARDLRHGFASFSSFFPEGRDEIQRIESQFLQNHLPEIPSDTPLVFTDQYISSGGQLFELLSGRDRFVADVRPLVFDRLSLPRALSCHPYDLASLSAAFAYGCVIEDPWGQPLSAPLDTTSPVAWVGYANNELARILRPLLRETLIEQGYTPQ